MCKGRIIEKESKEGAHPLKRPRTKPPALVDSLAEVVFMARSVATATLAPQAKAATSGPADELEVDGMMAMRVTSNNDPEAKDCP